MRFRLAAIFCLALIPSLASADVTLLYRVEMKLNPDVPPAFAQAINNTLAAMASSERLVLIKDGKSYTRMGAITAISDTPHGRITLLDPATKHYADQSIAEFVDEMAKSLQKTQQGGTPAAQAALASMKVDASGRVTGRTQTIQGIQAEEHEATVSLSSTAIPGQPAVTVMKMTMAFWIATPLEVTRNAALREYASATVPAAGGLDTTNAIQKLLTQFPQLGDGLSSLLKEVSGAGAVQLRMSMRLSMPILSVLASAQGNPMGKFDPDAYLIDVNDELVELSTATVASSMFAIPEGYTAAPLAEIMAAARPKVPVAPAATAPIRGALPQAPPVAPPITALPDQAPPPPPAAPGRGAGLVTRPSLVQRVDPIYTEEARAGKVEGAVMLSIVVGTDGRAGSITVTRSLGFGLDQKAIEAVQQWVFKPGEKNGVPVNTRAAVEVNFRLLAKPPAAPASAPPQ